MRSPRTLCRFLVLIVFLVALAGCSTSITSNNIYDTNGVPLFISSTLKNAIYLGGGNHTKAARYIDGQQNVPVRDHPELSTTFYNFGFWEGDEIELPQAEIRSCWHNNDYESSIKNATKKWIAEYSLYYLDNGTAYCECRYKLRVNAPTNGIYYCYSEITYIGSIDISTLAQNDTTPVGTTPPASSSEVIANAIKDGQTVATGSRGDYIVKVKETESLLAIARCIKDSMFVSINPFPYIEDGYMLINVVPFYSQYRILDPSIHALDGDKYYSVAVRFS